MSGAWLSNRCQSLCIDIRYCGTCVAYPFGNFGLCYHCGVDLINSPWKLWLCFECYMPSCKRCHRQYHVIEKCPVQILIWQVMDRETRNLKEYHEGKEFSVEMYYG
jgi:hypothetical protein